MSVWILKHKRTEKGMNLNIKKKSLCTDVIYNKGDENVLHWKTANRIRKNVTKRYKQQKKKKKKQNSQHG